MTVSACIDCGAEGTPVKASHTDGGFVSRVRRCDTCQAREAEWRERWQAGLRRGRGARVTMPLPPTSRPSATVVESDRDRQSARVALLDLIG